MTRGSRKTKEKQKERDINAHALKAEKVAEILQTDQETGLGKGEVIRRQKLYGPNELSKKEGKGFFAILFDQFLSPIVGVLVAAAAIGFVFNHITEAIAVLVVVLINAAIGFRMEWQARKSMTALRKMSRARTKVIRDGAKLEIDSGELVPGDLVFLEAGDLVTADARIIQQNNLSIREDSLTGESTPVNKKAEELPTDTPLAERANCVFKGTMVNRGNARVIVTETGDASALGEIAEMAHKAEKKITPLDRRLAVLSRKLIWLTILLAVFIFALGMLRSRDWVVMIETAIALAIAAIPEGLPVIATISLARGMYRLSRKNVIVKTLEAVQTLGETDVIFTDKTGTITENRIRAEEVGFPDRQIVIGEDQAGQAASIHPDLPLLALIGSLCNDSAYDPEKQEGVAGDPLEIALHELTHRFYDQPHDKLDEYRRVDEIPFDAASKLMATVHEKDGRYLTAVKGATEVLADLCVNERREGKLHAFERSEKIRQMDEMAGRGLRVLSFAYKKTDQKPSHESILDDLSFVAQVGFVDPIRSDVPQALEECQKAGIKVVMVTGDHPETARYVARSAGLLREEEDDRKTVTGKELAKLIPQMEKNKSRLLEASVYSRVDPSQKLELVSLFQEENHITAMTGDGVNDAPALKKADIGISMGKRGTEAAKEVSDMILKDDAFPSIVLAVRQGRIIFRNIRNFVLYLLSCNLSEILVVASASFLNVPLPLLPLQILFLNVVTDVFPALAIGMNRGEKGIMEVPPRDPGEPILTRKHWVAIVVYGVCLTIGVLGMEYFAIYYLKVDAAVANNLTFYTLAVAQLWNVFNIPGRRTSFIVNEVTKNLHVWLALLFCILLLAGSYFLPVVSTVLALVELKLEWTVYILAFSILPVFLIQLLKRVFRVIK